MGRGTQRFGFFSFLLRTGHSHPGPHLVLVKSIEASPRDPGATSHHLHTSCLQKWSSTFHPITNHNNREMRTNCNPKKKAPVTNAGIDKAASCWSVLLPHSAVWCSVGETWAVGKG